MADWLKNVALKSHAELQDLGQRINSSSAEKHILSRFGAFPGQPTARNSSNARIRIKCHAKNLRGRLFVVTIIFNFCWGEQTGELRNGLAEFRLRT